MNKNTVATPFDVWWDNIGSAMRINANEDVEEFAKRVAKKSFIANAITTQEQSSIDITPRDAKYYETT